jgi:transcription elongation factor GreA
MPTLPCSGTPSPASERRVRIGSRVLVRDPDGVEEYTIVDDAADAVYRRISVDCPLGAALLGRIPGEAVLVRTPLGVRRAEILRVD